METIQLQQQPIHAHIRELANDAMTVFEACQPRNVTAMFQKLIAEKGVETAKAVMQAIPHVGCRQAAERAVDAWIANSLARSNSRRRC